MIERHTVSTNSVTTTADDLGDGSTSSSSATATDVLFAPEGLVENAGTDAPTVIGDATLYGVLPALMADDTVTHSAPCCDGADFALGTWQVVGGSKGWGGGKKAVPIRRTGAQ